MEVILKEDVAKLGSRGDVVKVAEGYGRNYLLPRKLAIQANESNKAVIVQMKAAAVRRSAKEKAQAEELAKQFDGVSVSFTRKSGENDQLFGSVTSSDLGERADQEGFQRGSPQDPVARAAEDPGRVHRPREAAQGRDRAFEGGNREGTGHGVSLFVETLLATSLPPESRKRANARRFPSISLVVRET